MAHLINDKLNKLEGKKLVNCNETCKYWEFPHLETAYILSDVFSVRKGKPCYEYQEEIKNGDN